MAANIRDLEDYVSDLREIVKKLTSKDMTIGFKILAIDSLLYYLESEEVNFDKIAKTLSTYQQSEADYGEKSKDILALVEALLILKKQQLNQPLTSDEIAKRNNESFFDIFKKLNLSIYKKPQQDIDVDKEIKQIFIKIKSHPKNNIENTKCVLEIFELLKSQEAIYYIYNSLKALAFLKEVGTIEFNTQLAVNIEVYAEANPAIFSLTNFIKFTAMYDELELPVSATLSSDSDSEMPQAEAYDDEEEYTYDFAARNIDKSFTKDSSLADAKKYFIAILNKFLQMRAEMGDNFEIMRRRARSNKAKKFVDTLPIQANKTADEIFNTISGYIINDIRLITLYMHRLILANTTSSVLGGKRKASSEFRHLVCRRLRRRAAAIRPSSSSAQQVVDTTSETEDEEQSRQLVQPVTTLFDTRRQQPTGTHTAPEPQSPRTQRPQ